MSFEDRLNEVIAELEDPSGEQAIRAAEKRAEQLEAGYTDKGKVPPNMLPIRKRATQDAIKRAQEQQKNMQIMQQAKDALEQAQGDTSGVEDQLEQGEETGDAISKEVESYLIAHSMDDQINQEAGGLKNVTGNISGKGLGSSVGTQRKANRPRMAASLERDSSLTEAKIQSAVSEYFENAYD